MQADFGKSNRVKEYIQPVHEDQEQSGVHEEECPRQQHQLSWLPRGRGHLGSMTIFHTVRPFF